MARSLDVPYPPTPDEVPDGYTDYSPEYRAKQNWLLVWVYVVFMVYLGMLFASLTATVWFDCAFDETTSDLHAMGVPAACSSFVATSL